MSVLYKEYVEIEKYKDSNFIKFQISFNKDTYHWATSNSKEKGYQLTATPVHRSKSKCGTFSTESFTAFQGFYKIIYPVNRQSKKRLEEAIAIFKKDKNKYIEHFTKQGFKVIE